jgi:hypothetical protein
MLKTFIVLFLVILSLILICLNLSDKPFVSGSNKEQSEITKEFALNTDNMAKNNAPLCVSAKNQVMKNLFFKSQEKTFEKAPVLENFEDYAPTGFPPSLIKQKRAQVSLSRMPSKTIKAQNEYDPHFPSQFSSERRTSFLEQTGKDDLNYFFDTNKDDKTFAQNFDPIERPNVPFIDQIKTKNL